MRVSPLHSVDLSLNPSRVSSIRAEYSCSLTLAQDAHGRGISKRNEREWSGRMRVFLVGGVWPERPLHMDGKV